MSRNRTADFTPHFRSRASRHDSGDIDTGTALALNDVLHRQGQSALLHQVNDSLAMQTSNVKEANTFVVE